MLFQDRLNKKLIEDVILYIIIVFSAILFAMITADCFNLYFHREKTLTILPPPPAEKIQTKTLQEYIDSSAPLFRSSDSLQSSSSSQSAQAAVASSLTLKATFVGDNVSIAVISVSGEDHVFSVGETVAGMQIEEILQDRILLIKSGNPEPIALRMNYGFVVEEPLQVDPMQSQDAQADGSTLQKEISKREFAALLDPPDRIAKEVALAPIGREGNPYGIQMTFVKPGSLIQQMGFMPGDILLSMNNKQLLTPEDGMIAYQTMKNEDSVAFKIERAGSVINLNISFK